VRQNLVSPVADNLIEATVEAALPETGEQQ
jgi:hypothetical protein